MAHICGRLGWEGAHDFAESEDKNGHLEKENITQGGWDIHGRNKMKHLYSEIAHEPKLVTWL